MKAKKQPRPKNAYEMCERAAEAIAAHPLNYYQGEWMTRRDALDRSYAKLPDKLDKPENECGTAFCRAGWLVTVVDGVPDASRNIYVRAHMLLMADPGGDRDYDVSVSKLFLATAVDGTPGTKRYVSAGVSGLRAFMRTWKARLLAMPIQKEA